MKVESVQGLGDPELVVLNDSDQLVTVHLTGTSTAELAVPPHETRSVRVPEGAYTMRMTSLGDPFDTNLALQANYRYTYRHFLRLEVDDPTFAQNGFYCFPVKGAAPLGLLRCAKREERCNVDRAEHPNLDGGACTPFTSVSFFRARKQTDDEKAVPSIVFVRADTDCEAVRTKFTAHMKDHVFSACEHRP